MKKSKKASIEVQFNWVFVLIAGAVILIAFFSFISKQRAASDQGLAESLVKDIAFLAEGAASAKKAWQTIEGTSRDIEPKCEEDCSCSLNVGGYTHPFGDLMLFVPSPLSGDKLVFWSQDWSIPFRTTNFLYMSSKNIKYWLVYTQKNEPLIEEITSIFPRELTMQTIHLDDLNTIESEDYEFIKIVFLNSGFFRADDLAQKLHESLERVNVKGVLIDQNKAEATFYEKINPKKLEFVAKKAPIAGLATILGAIFSEDQNMYSCQLEKALEKSESVIRIYAERTRDFRNANIEGCVYEGAINMLDSMASSAGQLSLGVEGQRLQFPIEDLEQVNRDLLNQGCPLVY